MGSRIQLVNFVYNYYCTGLYLKFSFHRQPKYKLCAPLATKFTYKMRSGGKGMWGRGPTLYKHNYYKKRNISKKTTKTHRPETRGGVLTFIKLPIYLTGQDTFFGNNNLGCCDQSVRCSTVRERYLPGNVHCSGSRPAKIRN